MEESLDLDLAIARSGDQFFPGSRFPYPHQWPYDWLDRFPCQWSFLLFNAWSRLYQTSISFQCRNTSSWQQKVLWIMQSTNQFFLWMFSYWWVWVHQERTRSPVHLLPVSWLPTERTWVWKTRRDRAHWTCAPIPISARHWLNVIKRDTGMYNDKVRLDFCLYF